MPKENTGCIAMDGFRVEVGWERDGHVQIATTNQNSPYKIEPDKPDESPLPFNGWHVTLGRDGINKLIHDLRRARTPRTEPTPDDPRIRGRRLRRSWPNT